MDYEAKFNALVGRIKRAYLYAQTDSTKSVLEDILPELAESEDERIREKLIENFKWFCGDFPETTKWGKDDDLLVKDILAWLEKQESVGEIVARCKTSWYNEGKIQGQIEGLTNDEKYQQGWHDALEKQGEQKPVNDTDEEYNGEDYGIDSLWHAKNILEKTLGKVDGYQSDDGILEHKCAITAVMKLYEQKSTWSEEDVSNLDLAIYHIRKEPYRESDVEPIVDWLRTLKERVLPQPKQVWSEEDNKRIERIYNFLWKHKRGFSAIIWQIEEDANWLKSLRPQKQWKPSKEQIDALDEVYKTHGANSACRRVLITLLNDLKKL